MAVSASSLTAATEAGHDLRKTDANPNYWYPLVRSRALKSGKALGVKFTGEPIVLVRTKNGSLFALEDRCAHRQVPLHLGVVHRESIQCGYHCWTYDRTGRCVSVPYLAKGEPMPRGVRSYPCREAYGLIFVFPGDPKMAERVAFPHVPTYADARYKTRYLDRAIRCHYTFMHENLMDMNHQFLHRSLMGRIRTRLLDLRKGEDWVEVDYTFSRAKGKQPLGEKFILGTPGDQAEDGQDLMTIRTQYPYQTLKFWTAGSEVPALDLWNIYVPIDADRRWNHTYGLMMIQKPPVPGLIYALWPFITWFTDHIFAQDQAIVEEEQRAFDHQGRDCNQEIFKVIQALRTVLLDCGVSAIT